MEKTDSKKPEKARIQVTGMTCTTCAATIEKGLAETPAWRQAKVNFASEQASVEYDPSKVDLAKIKDTISELGYGIATRKSIFPVSGMTCASCVARVEKALSDVPGVISVNVNLASEKATVEYTDDVTFATLRQAVRDAGYDLGEETETLEDVTTLRSERSRVLRNRFIVAVVLAAVIMVLSMVPIFPGICLSALGAGDAGAVLGRAALLSRRLGGTETPDCRYEYPDSSGHLCCLSLQYGGWYSFLRYLLVPISSFIFILIPRRSLLPLFCWVASWNPGRKGRHRRQLRSSLV